MSNFVINAAYLNYLNSTGPIEARPRPSIFKLGSSFGYTATELQPSLNGSVVYTGTVTYRNIGQGVADLLIVVPPGVGPFEFGEIGLYLGDGSTLVGVYVYPALVSKIPAASSGVNSVISVHCLMKLAQGVASISVTNSSTLSVPIFSTFGDVVDPPSVGSDLAVVSPAQGPVVFLERSSSTSWTLQGYERIASGLPVTNVSTVNGKTVFQVSSVDVSNTTIQNRYILQYQGRLIRGQSIAASGVQTSDELSSWLQDGLLVDLWERTAAKLSVHLTATDPHPQYMTSAEVSAAYTPIAHTGEADPHSQYLLKTDAVTTYLPLTHLSDSNPHPQYLQSASAVQQFLSRAVNNLIQDSSGQNRFRFNSPSGSPGLTEIFGQPDPSGSVFEIQQNNPGGGHTTLLRVFDTGRVEAPEAPLNLSVYDKAFATTEWVVNKLRNPSVIVVPANSSVPYSLTNFHEIVQVNYTGEMFTVPVVMTENAVYEFVITILAGPGKYVPFLVPNSSTSNGSINNSWYGPEGYSHFLTSIVRFDLYYPSSVGNSQIRGTVFNFRDNKQVQYESSAQTGASWGSAIWASAAAWTNFGYLNIGDTGFPLPVASSINWSIQLKRVM